MSIVTITAELVPATGLTQITTYRDGVSHAVKWVDIDASGKALAVVQAAREAIGDVDRTVIIASDVSPDLYSMTVEVG